MPHLFDIILHAQNQETSLFIIVDNSAPSIKSAILDASKAPH